MLHSIINQNMNLLGINIVETEYISPTPKHQQILFSHVNESLKEYPNKKSTIYKTRTALLFKMVEYQTVPGRKPNYNGIKFNNPVCEKCKGFGGFPIMEIGFNPNEITCMECDGLGIKISICKTCKGTGKVNNNKCRTCKGTGEFIHYKNNRIEKCNECHGKKKLRSHITTGKILNFIACEECNGSGEC